jgi:DNA-binding transcriptional ArsR family regulator
MNARSRLPPVDLPALLARLRQGAANIAGVSYQIAVTALLLIDGIGGDRVMEVSPEQFEDVDCTLADGSLVLVQVKERGAGLATLGLGEIARAVHHATDAMRAHPESRLVIVTDAAIAVDPGRPLARIVGLESVDDGLLARTSVISVGWNDVAPKAIAALESAHGVGGAVARLSFDRLVVDLARAASEQRNASLDRRIRRTASDVEQLVREIAATVDLSALTEAEMAGVIAPVDFSRPLVDEEDRFLHGVDVVPGHIAAGLDFLRVEELDRIFAAVREDRLGVIAGPSGAGKSALLWRAAFELGGRFKVSRLRSVHSDQVEVLARFARLQSPSVERPLLICVDDLGRPGLAAWNDAADALLEIPHVYLLASVRSEDLSAALLRGRARPVEPRLDERLAREITAQAAARGIAIRLEFEEALDRADGLLMEFVSLLISGRRLQEVIAAQVDQRLDPTRVTEREVLRFVAGAHAAGISISGPALRSLVDDPAGLPAALERLRDEFLVTETESGRWTGLHELRSEQVSQALHAIGEPTRAETVARLAAELEPPDCTRLLLHAAGTATDVGPAAMTIAARLRGVDARDVSAFLEGLLRVDGLVHARACLEAARYVVPSADEDLVDLSYLHRFAGVDMSVVPIVATIASRLPDRPPSLAAAACSSLQTSELEGVLASAALEDATAAAEAFVVSQWSERLPGSSAGATWRASRDSDLPQRARLLAALSRLAGGAELEIGGPLGDRVELLARHYRDILDARSDHPARLELDVFDSGADKSHLVEIARTAYDLCPELDLVGIQRVGSSGQPSTRIDSRLEASRQNLPNPVLDIQRNILFREGLQRTTSAGTWTERLRRQHELIVALQELFEGAAQRLLNRHDNSRRRAQWQALAVTTSDEARLLPAQPLPPVQRQSRDRSKVALTTLANAIRQLADELDALQSGRYIGIASQIRDALATLDEAPPAGIERWPITQRLVDDALKLRELAEQVADLLLARAEDASTPRRTSGASWQHTAAEFVRATRDRVLARERRSIELALVATPHDLVRLPQDQTETWRLVGDRWLALVAVDQWERFVTRDVTRIDRDTRGILSMRMWAMPYVDGVLLPIHSVVVTSETVLPLPPIEGEQLAAEAGRSYISGPTLSRVVDAIVRYIEADRAAAHARLRGQSLDNAEELTAAESLLAKAEAAARALTIPDTMRRSFDHMAGLVRMQRNAAPPITLSAGEDWLEIGGQSSLHTMLADGLITNAVQLAIERGEIRWAGAEH